MLLSKIHILILLTSLFLMPIKAQGKDYTFYTLQAGSYTKANNAVDQFNTIKQGASGEELKDLRIEKVGEFYAVRIGKFKDNVTAREFLQASTPQMNGAIIVKSFIKEENMIKEYGGAAAVKDRASTERHLYRAEPAAAEERQLQQKPVPAGKSPPPLRAKWPVAAADNRGMSRKIQVVQKSEVTTESEIPSKAKEPLFFTVQTGSFPTLTSAMKEFDNLAAGLLGLNGTTISYLRIEKVGEFYVVRVGKFMNYFDAGGYLQGIRSQISGAIILKAHIKDKNIIKRYAEDMADEDAVTTEAYLLSEEPDKAAEAQFTQKPLSVKEPMIPEKGEALPDVEGKKDKAGTTESSQKTELNTVKGFVSKIGGKKYISDYYSRDSDDYDLHVLSSRLNLYKREEDRPGFYFEFDGKVRKKIVEGDLRGHVPRYKVDEAWLGYKFPGLKFRAIAGRQYIQEMYNTEIDGLNVNYSFENGLGLGGFGGLAPDKFDDSFNDDYNSFGGYAFLKLDNHQASLGYEYLTYKGEPDREYFSFRANSRLSKKLRFNGLSSVSKNQATNNFDLETANANLSYSFSRNLRFKVFGNYYRTIKYYESSKFYYEFSDTDDNFLLDTNSQTRAGIRVDYKIARGLKVYGATTYQHREVDDEDSTRYTAGIRKYDLYGFDLSGRYTYIDNYSSRDHEYNAEIYRNIMGKLDVSVYASYEETKLNLENAYTSGARTYGTSLYWPITKKVYLSMFAEYLDEDDYSSMSLYTQLGYKIVP